MEPPIVQSVTTIRPGSWAIGSAMLVEKVRGSPSEDAIHTWDDGSSTYCIRPNSNPIKNKLPPPGDWSVDRIYECSSAAASWAIGENTICKVRSWKEGKSSELETMKFVRRKAPSVPVVEPYYYWIDREWNRSYLFMRRASGQSLEKAWNTLTERQRRQLATELTGHVSTLAKFTSIRLESADCCGTELDWLVMECPGYDKTLPPFVPQLNPRYTRDEFKSTLREYSGIEPPSVDRFHFYHCFLVPESLMVVDPVPEDNSTLPLLACINDWEWAMYLPRWWISTIVVTNPAFRLDRKLFPNVRAWSEHFGQALVDHKFRHEADWYWRQYDTWVANTEEE